MATIEPADADRSDGRSAQKSQLVRWTIVACAAIVVYDAVSAAAAEALNFNYVNDVGALVSMALYALPALVAALERRRARVVALASASVALVDGTLGFGVAWLIGPGAPPPDGRDPVVLIAAVTVVIAFAAVIGLIVGMIVAVVARLRVRPR